MPLVIGSPTARCFPGGQKMHELISKKATSEACLKDDVSQVKITTEYLKNDTGIFARMIAYRKWTVADWHECRPKKTLSGSITVIEVDTDMMINSAVYTCDKDCTVNIDKENAQVVLHTDGINNFEVSGTTVIKAWFKTTATIPLQQTCEHIKIICGRKVLQFHSCFKHHMSCIRYLHNSMIPGRIANAICQNLELLIITTITLIIFSLLILLAKTYLCYLLLPLFIPIAYIYGFIYDKSCKKCRYCGLAYHPFTKCGEHCVCGSKFETSERMKMHRDSGMCGGYKSLRSARVLCKSKASALSLSVILSVLLLGFLTPIQGAPLKTNFTIDELPDFFREKTEEVVILQWDMIYSLIIDLTLIAFALLSIVCINHFVYTIASIYAMYCNECDMYHPKTHLTYFGDFTNHCGRCTCGQLEEINGVRIHKRSTRCLAKYKVITFRHIIVWIILTLIVKDIVLVAKAKPIKDCLASKHLEYDCTGPFLEIDSCSMGMLNKPYNQISDMLKSKSLISSLDQSYITILTGNIDNDIKKLNEEPDLHKKLLLEISFLTRNCDYYLSYNTDHSSQQLQWLTLARTNILNYCRSSSEIVCTCIKGGSCTGLVTKDTAMKTYYESNSGQRQVDFDTLMGIAKFMVPGTGFSYLANKTTSKEYDKIKEFFEKFLEKHPNNMKLKSFKLLMDGILKEVTDVKTETDYKIHAPKYVPVPVRAEFTDMLEINFNQSTANDGFHCNSPEVMVCVSPRTKISSKEIFVCQGVKKFLVETYGLHLYKLDNSDSIHCVGDKHCVYKYRVITPEESSAYRTSNYCQKKSYTEPQDYLNQRLQICRQKATGKCKSFSSFRVSLCENGLIYPEAAKQSPKNTAFPNDRCFEANCKVGQYPYNNIHIKNCTWENIKFSGSRPRIASYENFQEYKEQLIKKIASELTINKFKPVENLPYFIPNRKYLTLKGVNTADGMDGTFVEFEIPALTGTAAGYMVYTPEGQELFDFNVYIKNAAIYANYDHIYSTGPTIAINNKHDEHCTGNCPQAIPHAPGWATFSKERTSNWGCEEFGCMAIHEGCLYGSCQDVIRPEMDVYSKVGSDRTEATVCITLNHETYCQKIDATTPIITEKIEMQYKTVESKILPRLVAIKGHKLFVGQINDLGSFGKYCGNVQVTHNQTLGLADVKFDYTCHAAKRKDVIIRKCFDNSYQSCKLLKENPDLALTELGHQIAVNDNCKITGNLAVKAVFGDFNYKSYTKDLDFEAEISCVGCFNCLHGIICSADIKTTVEVSCNIISECPSFSNRLIIKPNVEKYNLMFKCDRKVAENNLKIRICDKEIESHITLANENEKIELTTGEQSTYIHEEDLRCATWLCKFKEEGLSFIFNPLLSWLGSYTWPVFIVIILIVVLFLSIYIFMPMCLKLRDILKKNEYEHLQEIKTQLDGLPPVVKYRIKPFA